MQLSFLCTVLLLLIYFIPSTSFATGACCAITKGEKNRLSISGTFATARSHEKIDGKLSNLEQQAFLLRFVVHL